jgi:hypothetical protein
MEAAAHEGLPGIKKNTAKEFLSRTPEKEKSKFAKFNKAFKKK